LRERDRLGEAEGDCKAESETVEFAAVAASSPHDVTAFSRDDMLSAVSVLGGVSVADVCCWLP